MYKKISNSFNSIKIYDLIFNKITLTLFFLLLSINAASETFQLGDVAPRGAPDGLLNAADALILQKMVLGDIIPDDTEKQIGDVAPLGAVDGVLNTGDLVVQQRAIFGVITLGTVNTLPPAPTLNAAVSPTTDNPYLITGTASPNVTVDIYVEGVLQHKITSNPADGTFSVEVYLYDGLNDIYATESDGVDVSPNSNTLQVQYNNIINRTQSGTIIEDTVWTPGSTPQPYIISSTLTIDADASLIIQPGTELKFETVTSLIVNGSLIVSGSSQDRVIFTSNNINQSAGNWQGINIGDGGIVTIDYAVVEYAANGVYFNSGSGGSVTNSRITNNQYGIKAEGDSISESKNPFPIVTNNSIYNNANFNYFARYYVNNDTVALNANNNWWGSIDASIIVGTGGLFDYQDDPAQSPLIDVSAILDADDGSVYSHTVLHGQLPQTNTILNGLYTLGGALNVEPGQTLTIEAGSRFESSGSGVQLVVKGTLNVAGNAQNQVVFTSNKFPPAVGNWAGISIVDGSIVNIDYAVIEYATTGISVSGGDLDINNSTVQSNTTGIEITGSDGQISNSIINSNSTGIVLINASPTIQSSQIVNNTSRGLYLFQQSSPLINNNNVVTGNSTGFFLTGDSTIGNYPQPIVNNNQILNNSKNVLATSYYHIGATPKVDFQNNWWGSIDISVIEGKITDHADFAANYPVVDFTGYLSSAGGSIVPGAFLAGGSLSDTQPGGNGLVPNTIYNSLGNITVLAGETLTIPEGVQLQFSNGKTLNVDGTLIIQGAAVSPVVFTNQGGNSWAGVNVSSTATGVNLNYLQIENADTGITITGSDVVITNSTIQNNQNGISITEGNGQISNSIIQNNNIGITLTNASPTIQANQIRNNTSIAVYLLQQSSPNTNSNIISANGFGFSMTGNSTIGNYPQPIVNNNQIDNATNVSATSYYYSGSVPQIDFQSNWWGTTDVATISASINDYIDSPVNAPVIDYTNLLSGAGGNAVPGNYLLGGDRFDAQSGGNGLIAGMTYQVLGDITVPAGETLTVPAGVQFRFPKNAKLNVNGSLVVQGTINSPVIFTSSEITPAMLDWHGIVVQSDANVIIDYAIIEYANLGVQFLSGSNGTISNSILVDNLYGIYVIGLSNPVIDSNTIVNNQFGIYVIASSGNPEPVITNNDIYANTANNLVISSTSTTSLNINGNWWGTDDIPTIRASISVTDDILVLLDNIATVANNSAVPLSLSVTESFISPTTSIGTKDTTALIATLSRFGNWLIDVINESSQLVKNYSGSSLSISEVWDGTDNSSLPLPDGKYRFSISVDGVKTREFSVIVDNTLPTAIITSPAANVILNTTSTMDITGIVTDDNIVNYIIEVADNHTPTEGDYRLLTSAQLLTSSSLFAWLYNDVTGTQEFGEKTIRLSVTDKAGNKSTYTVPITLNYLAITNVNLASDFINPTNNDSVDINFTLQRPATVTLRIYNETEHKTGTQAGGLGNGLVPGTNLVREISVTYATANSYVLSWDGLDGNGKAVQQDAYRFELTAVSGNESNVYYPVPVLDIYNDVPPVLNTIDYANYAFYKNEYITSTVTVPPSKIVRVFLNASDEIPVINTVVDEGEHAFLVDGRDDRGRVAVTGSIINTGIATIYQKDNNAIFVKNPSPSFKGTESHPDIEIKSDPYLIKHSYDQVSSIAFTVSEDSYVTVELMKPCLSNSETCSTDPAVASVKTIIDNELLVGDDGSPATIHTFEWRGYDFSIVNADTNNILTDEEGFYTFLITATGVATELETTYRGSLLLYH